MTTPPNRPAPRTKEEFREQLRAQLEANAAVAARRPPRGRSVGFPRALPWASPVSRLWPGTKILCLLTLTSLMLWVPRWPTIGLVAACFALTALVARVPRSVVPRVPFLLWWGLFWGGVTASFSGGLEPYVRSVVLGLVLVYGTMLLLWTTRPDHLAPTFAALMWPLRIVRAPVDEWARTMALSLRGLPVLATELRTMSDAGRLRGGWQRRVVGKGSVRQKYGALLRELADTITAALSSAERRATATGRAMTLRGGVPPVPRERVRLGIGDLLAVLVTAGVVAASLYLRGR